MPTGPASKWPWCRGLRESQGSRELKDRLEQVGGRAGLYQASGVLTIDSPWQSEFFRVWSENKEEGPARDIKIRKTL